MVYPADMGSAASAHPDASFADRALIPPGSGPAAKPDDNAAAATKEFTAGNAHVVWGNHGDGVTATATIKDNFDEIVGTVVVDRYQNKVTVTKVDPETHKSSSATFTYSDNKIRKRGSLEAESAGPDYNNSFTDEPTQEVMLRPLDSGQHQLPISVEIAHNLGVDSHYHSTGGLGVIIGMEAPKNAANRGDDQNVLVLTGGSGDGNGDCKVDPKQMTADFYGDNQEPAKVSASFVSPMPRDDTPLGKLERFLGL